MSQSHVIHEDANTMHNLTIDTFVRGASDFERAQYEILGSLQSVRTAFAQNIIFPHLSHLVSLHGSLEQILEQSGGIRGAARGPITGVDPDSQTVIVDQAHVEDRHMAAVEDLIRWALPKLKATMEEGSTICEFVEDHLHLEEVGIMPSYVNEGYLIIPVPSNGVSQVLRYEMSLYQSSEEQFRTLRTTLVRTIAHATVRPSPSVLKLELLEAHREFPNPATFAFDSSIEFPYEATTLPLAKRKLMRHLYARRGLA